MSTTRFRCDLCKESPISFGTTHVNCVLDMVEFNRAFGTTILNEDKGHVTPDITRPSPTQLVFNCLTFLFIHQTSNRTA